MKLRGWDPLTELEALRREVERAYQDFEDGNLWPFSWTAFLPGRSARNYPLLNAYEDENNVYVEGLAPGIDPEKLNISVTGDILRIEGEKQQLSPEIKQESYHRNERSAGKFLRSMTLPSDIDTEKVSADYSNGVLRITLPKAEKAKPKKISVNVS